MYCLNEDIGAEDFHMHIPERGVSEAGGSAETAGAHRRK
jgi:hypothetical protein